MRPDRASAVTVRESDLGMGRYLTENLPGTGGRLKAFPEDFVVEEVPLEFPKPQATGKYTVAAVRARNWETNRLVREIADRLGVSKKSIFFAGTKDKRAVTTQYVSVRAPLEKVVALGIRDVEILEAFRVDRAPKIGELVGNRFDIAVRETAIPFEEAEARAKAILARLETAGGFPNYFGVQRFGVVRPLTHVMGRLLTEGRYEEAVWTYCANPLPGEEPVVFEARERLTRERDPKAALRYYPTFLSFERQMLHHLAENPGDYVGAIRAVPTNLAMMFVYAHQSLLFNRMIAKRMQRGLALGVPEPGDLVAGLTPDGTPDRSRFIPVSERNLEKARRQCAKGRALVTGLIVGTDVETAKGAQGEIEEEVLREAGVKREDFLLLDLPEIASVGTRRELLAPLGPVTLARETDAHGELLRFRFFLGKGTYATSFLREVLKSGVGAYA